MALPAMVEQHTADDFAIAITDAKAKANQLARIVEECKLYAVIQGKKYLEVEAWETIGRAYGYTAKTEWTRRVDGGGWEARAVVIDSIGMEVGAAEAECATVGDGDWTNRSSAAQRSMAQTRAVSKALRSILSWVVVLAGYEPTPAAEAPPAKKLLSKPQVMRLHAIATAAGVTNEQVKDLVRSYGVEHANELTREQYEELCSYVEGMGANHG